MLSLSLNTSSMYFVIVIIIIQSSVNWWYIGMGHLSAQNNGVGGNSIRTTSHMSQEP